MEVVRPGLQNNIRHGSASASELRGIVARAYVHRLDCLGRRNVDLKQTGTLIVVHSFNLQVVEQARLAIYFR